MSDDAFSPPSPATPSEIASTLRTRRRRRGGAFAAVALLAGSAGLIAGTRLRSSPAASPAPAASTADTPAHAGHAGMPGMEQGPPPPPGAGSQAVYISSARQQLIGVRSAAITRRAVEGTVRTVGALTYDETRTAQIHTRVAGWVEQLHVDYVGKLVRRGQPLFAVYSPDLATAQGDYLVALRARQKLADNANADLRAGADALLSASRERMRRWNVSDAQIAELEATGQPSRTVAIASPFDGIVLEKDAVAGQYVTPEMTSFKLADLTTLWAVGQVFEYEAARLRIGDAVEVEFPYGQAARRAAKIDFIYPDVDRETRRVRFRVTLDNRDHTLKPDTYVQLVWHGASTEQLVIPREAVIDTGPRKYALLAQAHGYFEPRDVTVGPAVGNDYPVISGLAEGDRVVTSAQFLVDSETNLMAAMAGMAMTMPGMDMPGMDMKSPPQGDAMPGMDMSQPGTAHSHHAHGGAPANHTNSAPATSGSATSGAAAMPGMPGM